MMRNFTLVLALVAMTVLACAPSQSAASKNKVSTAATSAAAAAGLMPAGCHYRQVGTVTTPDPVCTPGATNPLVTEANLASTICRAGSARTVQLSEAFIAPIKRRLMVAYHAAEPAGDYELDHLVPLEVGGAPSTVTNLWPELNSHPAPGVANVKDPVEDYVHHAICARTMTLRKGQQIFMTGEWATLVDDPAVHSQIPHAAAG